MSDLTTLANVKGWLNITTNGDDAVLQRMISSVSQYVQSWLNRSLLSASYTEKRSGTGTHSMALSNYPIRSIASLVIDGVTIPASTDGIQSGYMFDERMLYLVGYTFTPRLLNVAISYTAGYAVVPPEIEQAVIDTLSLRYRERTRIGEVSKSMGGETVSFSQKDFSDSAKTILNNYRKVVSVI